MKDHQLHRRVRGGRPTRGGAAIEIRGKGIATDEAEIRALLGDHEEAVLPDGTRWTRRTHTRKGYTVHEQTVRRLTIKPNGGNE